VHRRQAGHATNESGDDPQLAVRWCNRESVKVDGATGDHAVLCDEKGHMWVFMKMDSDSHEHISCWHYDGKTWSIPQQVTPAEFFNAFSASLAPSGPMLFWQIGGVMGGSVYMSALSGGRWSKPKVLAETRKGARMLDSCVDGKGNIHVVYDDALEPPEEYGMGFIIVDGVSPKKAFHIMFDGKKWSEARATTGRARFDITHLNLCVGPKGQVYLGATIHTCPPLADTEHYPACARWDGKRWTQFERLTRGGFSGTDCQVAVDSKGAKHAAWAALSGSTWHIRKIDGQTSKMEFLGHSRYSYSLKADSEGRVFVCFRGEGGLLVKVWNGSGWSAAPALPTRGYTEELRLTPSPRGKMFLSWVEYDEASNSSILQLQEIIVEQASKKAEGQ